MTDRVIIMFRADHSYEWSLNDEAETIDTGAEALAGMAELHKLGRRLKSFGLRGNDPMHWRDLGQTFPACPIGRDH